jgi:Asp-tRNA(Asn)/Glu-tRNA(Gln) amidotransferase A subunit family amidase
VSNRSGVPRITDAADEFADDPEVFHGMPVGLQIVGRRFEDEKIVAILKHFESRKCLPELPQFHEAERGANVS